MCRVKICNASSTIEDVYSFSKTNTLYRKMKDFGWYYFTPSSKINEFEFLLNVKIAMRLSVTKAEEVAGEVFSVGFQNNVKTSLLKKETGFLNNDAGVILPYLKRSDDFSSIWPNKKRNSTPKTNNPKLTG